MDQARKITDELLEDTEKKINEIYAEAYKGISKKWDAYMKSHAPKVEKALIELQEAIDSGDRDRIAKAKEHYAHTVKNVTVNDERFRAMRDETVAKISHVNEVALDYVNGEMPEVYTLNYNAFGTQKVAGYSFSLVSEQAVRELVMTDDLLLPKKKVDIPKDEAWNKKNINSQILQGILQGESMPKMAKRLRTVTDMNRASSIRNARTMFTSAENKGRQDSFKKASDDGVIMEREWLAAHDSHTRAWHLDLNGKRVAVDEPWENDYGKIMYPGDPTADPANVYNCRCAIRAHVKGFAWNQAKEEENKLSNNLHFSDGVDDRQVEIISNLYDEYNSNLLDVSTGAHHAAGDVDLMGQYMHLSSKRPETAIHEFAHTLAVVNADKYGLSNNQEFWSEVRKVRTEYRKAVREDYKKIISSYADADRSLDEFMAEAFTQAKANELSIELPDKYHDDLTYSTKVLAIIDKYFKRKRR